MHSLPFPSPPFYPRAASLLFLSGQRRGRWRSDGFSLGYSFSRSRSDPSFGRGWPSSRLCYVLLLRRDQTSTRFSVFRITSGIAVFFFPFRTLFRSDPRSFETTDTPCRKLECNVFFPPFRHSSPYPLQSTGNFFWSKEG